MIRLAEQKDIPELVKMLLAFQSEAGCYDQITPCEKSLSNFMAGIITNADADAAVYEVDGIIAGATAILAYPSWFNQAQKVGQELFWYIKPEYRGKYGMAMRMFKWLERWAEDHKLQALTVASTGTLKVEKLGEFYEKRGFKMWDVLYTKEVS